MKTTLRLLFLGVGTMLAATAPAAEVPPRAYLFSYFINNGEETILYFDAYTRHRYEALATTDFKTWRDVSSELSVPEGIRHGTAFAVPGAVVRKLLEPTKARKDTQP